MSAHSECGIGFGGNHAVVFTDAVSVVDVPDVPVLLVPEELVLVVPAAVVVFVVLVVLVDAVLAALAAGSTAFGPSPDPKTATFPPPARPP